MKYILVKDKITIETSDLELVKQLRERGFTYKYSKLGELL